MVPPTELEFGIEKLERILAEKRAERDKKMKNLKSKLKIKKKAHKPKLKIMTKTFDERVSLFTNSEKLLFLESMDSLKLIHQFSESEVLCCP